MHILKSIFKVCRQHKCSHLKQKPQKAPGRIAQVSSKLDSQLSLSVKQEAAAC